MALADEAANRIESASAWAGISWPDALALDDVVQAAHQVVSNSAAVVQALDGYLTALVKQRADQREADNAEAERIAKHDAWQQERDRQRDELGGELIVRVHSPHPLAGEAVSNWLYPREVPLYVVVVGAKPSYVRPESPRRIRLALNGVPINVQAGAWQYDIDAHAMVLRHTVSVQNSALRDGLNVIEISAVDGTGERARTVITFAVDTSLEAQPGRIEIADDLSLFDAPGNDHVNANDEYFALRNVGGRSLVLAGWKVEDRIGHRYTFRDFELQPASIVRVRTGVGTDTDTDVHWGRNQAVWNNRGDAVYLIDASHVLQAEHVY